MDPLFVTDLDTLKENLRMSQVSTSEDTDIGTLLERAVRTVRVKFRKVLSQSRIDALVAITQASPVDPDENDEYLRELAELTEIQWIWLELSYISPMMILDSAAEARDVFQEEGPFRRMTQEELDSVRLRYQNEINENLDILKASESLDSNTSLRVKTIEPETDPRRVGKSWRKLP